MSDSERFLLAFVLFLSVMVFPLTWYLYRRGERRGSIVLAIFAIWFVWNLVNAPIHECAHWLLGRMLGLHATDYQLIQHFWKGDFVHGYIAWDNPDRGRLLFSTSAPYVADGLLIGVGFFLLRWRPCGPTTGALILAVTYLRSIFDVALNYSADTLFGGRGDFGHLMSGFPPLLVHLGAWLLILTGVALTVSELRHVNPARSVFVAHLPETSPETHHDLG